MAPSLRTKGQARDRTDGHALPTVILGFLAGLCWRPLVESYLPGHSGHLHIHAAGHHAGFVVVVVAACCYHVREFPDGLGAVAADSVVLLAGYLSFAMSIPMEDAWLMVTCVAGWNQLRPA